MKYYYAAKEVWHKGHCAPEGVIGRVAVEGDKVLIEFNDGQSAEWCTKDCRIVYTDDTGAMRTYKVL